MNQAIDKRLKLIGELVEREFETTTFLNGFVKAIQSTEENGCVLRVKVDESFTYTIPSHCTPEIIGHIVDVVSRAAQTTENALRSILRMEENEQID